MTQLTPIDLGTRADFHLGDVGLRPSQRELAGPVASVVLEPRVMQVLLALADAEGGVLSRDRLLALCWGGAIVGDDALNRAVAGARKALRDAGSTRLAVVTIPRVGYRLEHERAPDDAAETVRAADLDKAALARDPVVESTPTALASAAAGTPAAARRRDRRLLLASALGLTVLAGVGGWTALRRRRDPRAGEVDALIAQADQAMRLALAESDRQGIGFLRRAIELAPHDPRPWGRLALALRAASEYAAPASMRALQSESEAAAKRALQLDEDNADARIALATLLPTYGNWLSIDRAVREVFDAHPDHVPTIDALSFVWASAGLLRAHYPLRLRTVELDPFHAAYNFRSIYAHWMNGRLADADRAGARGLELWPRHAPTWLARVGVFGMTGRADRAVAMIDDDATRPELPPPLLASLRRSHAALAGGRADERDAAVEALLQEVAGGGPFVAVNAALLLAAFGAVEHSLDVVEAYLLERGPVMAGTAWRPGQALHYDVRGRLTQFLFLPVMAPLHVHPRFAVLMRDCGLAAFWRASGRRPEFLGTAPLP